MSAHEHTPFSKAAVEQGTEEAVDEVLAREQEILRAAGLSREDFNDETRFLKLRSVRACSLQRARA